MELWDEAVSRVWYAQFFDDKGTWKLLAELAGPSFAQQLLQAVGAGGPLPRIHDA